MMEAGGFKREESSACVFRHEGKDLLCSAHGDGFTTVGPKSSLDWFVEYLKTKYELKESARMGPAADDDKEGRVLNRMVRWSEEGLEYEGDPRQVERLVRELGLERAKPVATPGVKVSQEQIDSDAPIELEKVTHFRG